MAHEGVQDSNNRHRIAPQYTPNDKFELKLKPKRNDEQKSDEEEDDTKRYSKRQEPDDHTPSSGNYIKHIAIGIGIVGVVAIAGLSLYFYNQLQDMKSEIKQHREALDKKGKSVPSGTILLWPYASKEIPKGYRSYTSFNDKVLVSSGPNINQNKGKSGNKLGAGITTGSGVTCDILEYQSVYYIQKE